MVANGRTATGGRRRGFTLIEIMVVIGIIVVLVAVVIAVGSSVKTKGQVSQTKIILKGLTAIYESYLLEGATAQTTTGAGPVNTLITNALQMPALKRAVSALPQSAIQNTGTLAAPVYQVNDGFGNAIQFVYVSTAGATRSWYFQSAGPNGSMGDADDIYSYDP